MTQATDNEFDLQLADDRPKGGILRWVLMGTVAFLPVQIETSAGLRFAPSDLFLIVAAILGIGVWRISRPAWSIWHIALLGLLLASALVKGLTGIVTQYDLVNKVGGMMLLLSFYVCLTTLSDGWCDLRRFLQVFVVSVTIQNAASSAAFLWCKYSGSQDLVLMFLLSDSTDRLAGMLVDPNAYGGLLIVTFAIALLGNDSKNPLLPRWVQLASLLTLSIGLLLTSSRSAWIGFAMLILFGVIENPRLLVFIPVLVAAGLGAVAMSMTPEEFEGMVTISSRQVTIDERVEINANAWKMFLEHPIFGGGLGSFLEKHDIIVHNSAMWFLAEFGAIGLIVFLGLMAWFCVKGVAAFLSANTEHRPIIAGIFAGHLAMMGFSLGVEALYQRYWWFVMGLLASAYVLVKAPAADDQALDEIEEAPSGELVSEAVS